jgi:hypothetical protein
MHECGFSKLVLIFFVLPRVATGEQFLATLFRLLLGK